MRHSNHELATRRTIEGNPVKAALVLDPKTWSRSSARYRDDFGVLNLWTESGPNAPGARLCPAQAGSAAALTRIEQREW
jgi:hypothetical protein